MNNGSEDPIKPREAGDLLLRPHVFLVRHKGAKQNKPLNIQVQSSDKVSIKNKPTMTIDTVFFYTNIHVRVLVRSFRASGLNTHWHLP